LEGSGRAEEDPERAGGLAARLGADKPGLRQLAVTLVPAGRRVSASVTRMFSSLDAS
jgi:hypothetical protein